MARKNLEHIGNHADCRKLSLEIASLGRRYKYRPLNNSNKDVAAKEQTRLIGRQANACLAYQRIAPAKEKNRCKTCSVNPFTNWYKKHLVYK